MIQYNRVSQNDYLYNEKKSSADIRNVQNIWFAVIIHAPVHRWCRFGKSKVDSPDEVMKHT